MGNSKKIIIIPARMGSSRLYGKPLISVKGKPMIQRVVEQCLKAKGIDKVIVATEHEGIYDVAERAGATGIMTSPNCQSGSDRVAEAARSFGGNDTIINVQGDMPFVNPELIELIAKEVDRKPLANIITAAKIRTDLGGFRDQSVVKVICDPSGMARDFLRRAAWRALFCGEWRHHIGIYGFSNTDLQDFANLPSCVREKEEGLEQLRALVNGMIINVIDTDFDCGKDINTVEDLREVNIASEC